MLRIVSITVATVLLDCVVGAGAGAPAVDESPAKTVPESTHASANANAKRFIICSPLRFEDAKPLITVCEVNTPLAYCPMAVHFICK